MTAPYKFLQNIHSPEGRVGAVVFASLEEATSGVVVDVGVVVVVYPEYLTLCQLALEI